MIRYMTGGESHGRGLTAIVEGLPAGLFIDVDTINLVLSERQAGYGRGKRMSIEKDRVDVLSGVRAGYTIGSPVSLYIENKDWDHWQEVMSPFHVSGARVVTMPRPGHADLAGGMKYDHHDLRNVLERASARETAVRTAVGALAGLLLRELHIGLYSFVVSVGTVAISPEVLPPRTLGDKYLGRLRRVAAADPHGMNIPDARRSARAVALIKSASKRGDTLGGVFEVRATNMPAGLGSYSQWDRRLDGRLARAMMSIQAIKAVEIGDGMINASLHGSEVHDEIFFSTGKGFYRKTNRAGGIEGGISNGEEIIVRAYMKPIATLYRPLHSVDIRTRRPVRATVERSDVCAVSAASVVGESVAAVELAGAVMEKFGGDTMKELVRNYRAYVASLKRY